MDVIPHKGNSVHRFTKKQNPAFTTSSPMESKPFGVRPSAVTTFARRSYVAGVHELVIAPLLRHRSTFDPVARSFHVPDQLHRIESAQ
jgi:hypothetical protein